MPIPVHTPQASARLKVKQGPHKGTIYKLVANKVTIGRSSDSDICLIDDEKCSRKQAVIIFESKGYSIKDISKRSSLKINHLHQVYAELKDGDLIQFGNTVLQFEYKVPQKQVPAAPPIPVIAPKGKHIALKSNPTLAQKQNIPADLASPLEMPQVQHNAPFKVKKKKKRSKIMLVVGGLFLLWLFMGDSSSDSKDEERDVLITRQDKEQDVKTLSDLKEKEKAKRQINSLPNFKNAQFAYIKGMRDYRKGFYTRAIESFRVCQTLYPKHSLCANYLQKAKLKQQQLVQAWMVAGKYYREKREFYACMAAFQNVIYAIQDTTNIIHKEAWENYKICQIQYKDRY